MGGKERHSVRLKGVGSSGGGQEKANNGHKEQPNKQLPRQGGGKEKGPRERKGEKASNNSMRRQTGPTNLGDIETSGVLER